MKFTCYVCMGMQEYMDVMVDMQCHAYKDELMVMVVTKEDKIVVVGKFVACACEEC